MDYLDRESAPLTNEEWAKVDEAVITSARHILTGRRVVSLTGPLGAGTYDVPFAVYTGRSVASVDMTGEGEAPVISASSRKTVPLPLLYADFKISWRDIETDHKIGMPVDVSAAAMAAGSVSMQEDELIFNGNKDLGIEGLLNATGRTVIKAGNWDKPGIGLADIVKAIGALAGLGHYGPYAIVMSPVQYGKLIRAYGDTGLLEIDQISSLASAGVFCSNVITGEKAVIIETGAQNLSLAVGQDFTVGYLGAEKMNHLFRVMETATLLIKRPCSICTLE